MPMFLPQSNMAINMNHKVLTILLSAKEFTYKIQKGLYSLINLR